MKAKLILFVQIVVAVTALSGFCWGTYTVVHYLRTAPRFEVKKLSVSGSNGALKRVSENEILSQAEFEVGTNVFRVGLEDIRQRVERLEHIVNWFDKHLLGKSMPQYDLPALTE